MQYFAEVGKKQSDQIGLGNKLAEDFLNEINENNTLYLHLTDKMEIVQTVLSLK